MSLPPIRPGKTRAAWNSFGRMSVAGSIAEADRAAWSGPGSLEELNGSFQIGFFLEGGENLRLVVSAQDVVHLVECGQHWLEVAGIDRDALDMDGDTDRRRALGQPERYQRDYREISSQSASSSGSPQSPELMPDEVGKV